MPTIKNFLFAVTQPPLPKIVNWSSWKRFFFFILQKNEQNTAWYLSTHTQKSESGDSKQIIF